MSRQGRAAPWARGRKWLPVLAFCLLACGDDATEAPAPVVEDDAGPTPEVGEFPEGDEVDADAAWLERQCEALCLHQQVCGDTEASCLTDCLDGPAEDLQQLACLLAADCGAESRCEGDIPDDRNCPALCELVAGCGGFPSDQWGLDEDGCVEACNGYAHGRPDRKQDEINCYGRLLQDCRLDDVGQCRLDTGPDDACAQMCGRLTQECRAIPGPEFLTLGDCLDSCRSLDERDSRVFANCFNLAGCDRYARCWPPSPETPAGCNPFCDSFLSTCPGSGLNARSCPDACAGFAQALPGGAFAESAACINQYDSCPEGDEILICLLPEYDGCGEICGALEACGGDASECAGGCRFLAAAYPDEMDGVRDCAVDSACAQLGTCFQPLMD